MLNGAPASHTDRPLPGWITRDVIEQTRATWEPLYGHTLTDNQIIELLLNVGNLFRLLRDSASSQDKAKAAAARGDQDQHLVRRKPVTKKLPGDKACSTTEKNPCP